MDGLTFSPATAEQAPIIARLLSDSTDKKLLHGDTAWGSEGWSDQEVVDTMAESTEYIVYKDGEAVSTISIQFDDPRSWGEQPPNALYLHRLAVKEGMNGQGLGQKMINWAADQAKAHNRDFLRLDCPADNESLCKYYESQGFVKVSVNEDAGYDGYSAALYERPILKV